MRISTKGRYALRIMLDLAQHREDGYIPVKTIAERQEISKNYLDQIMILLARTDFLHSTRGAQGGYKLAHPPEHYTVGDILRATEGDMAPIPCLRSSGSDCQRQSDCLARHVWQGLDQTISHYLDAISLQDIINRPSAIFSSPKKSKKHLVKPAG